MQQQTIAIFGATSAEGILVTTALANSNHKLLLFEGTNLTNVQWMTMDLKKHFPLADIEVVSCQLDAAWEADIIIAALPMEAFVLVCEKIREVANRKIVVHVAEATNQQAATLCYSLLPYSKHVSLITEWSGKKTTVFVQSEHAEALNRIADLLDEVGITPVTATELEWNVRA